MGSLFGGGTQQTSSTTSSSPWAPQIPYLQAGADQALSIFNQQKNSPFYGGSLYASLNPQQQAALTALNGFASPNGGAGGEIADLQKNTGRAALESGVSGAMNTGGAIVGSALSNPTQSNIADAGAYANNPYTQGMIDAANRPIEQQLNEVAIPGLNRGAIGSGNFNSSRAGTLEAILRRNAGTQEADNASNILGNQYNNGLNLAQNARTSGLNTALGAANMFSGLANTGGGLVGNAYNSYLNNFNIPLQTATALQQDQQGQDQAGLQEFQAQQQYPWSVLDNYWNIAGKPIGGTSTVNGTQTGGGPGVLGGILGLASGIGSMFLPTGPLGLGASMASTIGGGLKSLF